MTSPLSSRALLLASAALLGTAGLAHAQNACDPHSYGAVNDATTDNAVAIQTAIDNCAAHGGGIVPIAGGGIMMTGPISLRSHIYLNVAYGTTLKNTADHSKYQPAFIGYPFEFKNDPGVTGTGPSLPGLPEAMISAYEVTNAGIIGGGTIDGSGSDPDTAPGSDGLSWWQLADNAHGVTAYPGFPDIPTSNGLPRPWLVEFYGASNIIVHGVTLTNSPMWHLGLRYCNNVTVSNYTVTNPNPSPNTDGGDIVGSNNVVMANLTIATGDDNVAIKSGLPGVPNLAYYGPPYNLPRIATSNVTVVNSKFGTGHGISVGSETVNGVHGIRINNITFAGTDNGFRIKTGRDRGNQIYDMIVQNLTMTDVPTPLSISEYHPSIPGPSTSDVVQTITNEPYVHDITISNVTATNPGNVRVTNTTGGLIIGVPESPIYNLSLNHIHIAAAKATYMRLRNLINSSCHDVTITPLNTGAPNNGQTFDNEGGLSGLSGCFPQ